ncbi:unnamed protein product [Echinostoma caproni]|uniref:Importin subunit alpha n=1 Tax=Echinostoma caproni TaxID=27848 RepID=A0A183A7C9_9TREM|nr:unnamed protein product [Echinostoma caproni]
MKESFGYVEKGCVQQRLPSLRSFQERDIEFARKTSLPFLRRDRNGGLLPKRPNEHVPKYNQSGLPFDHHLSTIELSQKVMVKDLLEKTNPDAVARAKRRQVTTESRPVPVDVGESAMRDYLLHNWRHEKCAEAAIVWFSEHSCFDKAWLPPNLSPILFSTLDLHRANSNVVHAALIVLAHLVNLGQRIINLSPRSIADDAPTGGTSNWTIVKEWANEELPLILTTMKQHSEEVRIQRAGLQLFDALISSTHPNITVDVVQSYLQSHKHLFEYLSDIGVVDHLLTMLQCDQVPLVRLALDSLWKFCVYPPIAEKALENNAFEIAISLMRDCPDDIALFASGPLLILAVSSLGSAQAHFMQVDDIVAILLGGLTRFNCCPDTIWNISLALNAVIVNSENAALQFVGGYPQTSEDGFDILYSIYKAYHDNTSVIEALMRIVEAVIRYEPVLRCIAHDSLHAMLSNVEQNREEHRVLVSTARDGLRKLAALEVLDASLTGTAR